MAQRERGGVRGSTGAARRSRETHWARHVGQQRVRGDKALRSAIGASSRRRLPWCAKANWPCRKENFCEKLLQKFLGVRTNTAKRTDVVLSILFLGQDAVGQSNTSPTNHQSATERVSKLGKEVESHGADAARHDGRAAICRPRLIP
ncbi:MAG TPA: hypothetical protein PKC18_02785 [Lacipirellulaceae bacterium]|nr:hypothetical protein [Lacipirellulaceae bacterium]